MRGELPTVAVTRYAGPPAVDTAWSRFLAMIADRDLQCVVAFCAIGFLVAINLVLWAPGYGETVSTLQAFP